MIIIERNGRLGNQMFQFMLARELQRRIKGDVKIYGYDMPEWGLSGETAAVPEKRVLMLIGQLFDLDEVAYALNCGLADAVVIKGWGMRLEYFGQASKYHDLFVSNAEACVLAEDEILISIRAEDIESGEVGLYYPMPFYYYEEIVRSTGLKPAFTGQIGPGPYADALRSHFPDARFLPLAASVAVDFQTLRRAKHVVLPISTFSWLAAWLSPLAETIHIPVSGLFDPRTGHQNLLPIGDPRYRFWDVDFPGVARRKNLGVVKWASESKHAVQLTVEKARNLVRDRMTVRVPMDDWRKLKSLRQN